MTAVARIEPQRGTITTAEPSFPELLDMGKHLVGTGFLPDHIKNGAQAAAIILAGRELGMQPMRALRSLVLVKGKVTEYADSQLARFKSDGGRATFTSLTDTEAHLVLTHPNGDKHTEIFTADDARKAGLVSNQNYNKFPKAMLRSRVITAGLKSVGWEGGSGVYDPAELATPTPAADTIGDAEIVDAITDAQHDLLTNLLKSHVFTETERARVMDKATTKDTASKAIEWAQGAIKKRKAAELDATNAEFTDDQRAAQRSRAAMAAAQPDPYEDASA